MDFVNKYLIRNPYVKNNLFYVLSILLVLVEMLNTVGFLHYPINPFVFPLLLIIPVIISVLTSPTKISWLYIFFFIYLGFNVYITRPPWFFNSWMRLALFVLLLFAVAPVVENEKLRYFRFNLFKYFCYIAIPLTILSFFGYFFGINYRDIALDAEFSTQGGRFSGFFNHSMMLGPIAAICSLVLTWKALTRSKIFWIFTVIAIGAVLFSASRAALIALIGGEAVLFITFSVNRKKAVQTIIVVAVLGVVTYPAWDFALDGIRDKNERPDSEQLFDSRQTKIDLRLEEIKDNPIFGIGFSAENYKNSTALTLETGKIEPGSSWLAVCSMTGLIGLVFFVFIFYKAFIDTINSPLLLKSLFLSLLTFFFIHLIVEGYVYAAGSPLCFLFWLIIGASTDFKYKK